MSVSRRGFLQGLRLEPHAHAAQFMAARGHEESHKHSRPARNHLHGDGHFAEDGF